MNTPLYRMLPAVFLLAAGTALQASPVGTVPLATALDTSGIDWQTGSRVPWFGQTVRTHDGVDAASSSGFANGESWLAATVSGPGVLRFRVLVDTEPAVVSVNGAAREERPREGWNPREIHLAPGPQQIRFAAAHSSVPEVNGDAFLVDAVTLTPQSAVPLGEAADAPALTWQGSAGVFGLTESGGGDVLVIQETAAAPGEASAALTGPAAVRFRWRSPGRNTAANLTVNAGGRDVLFVMPEDAQGGETWRESEVLVPAGAQTVRWRPAAGADFLLDAVTVVPAPALGAAVGQPALAWTGDWLSRPAPEAVGGAVAVTPVLSGEEQAVLTVSVTGPSEVTFRSCVLSSVGGAAFAANRAVPVSMDGLPGAAWTRRAADDWFFTTLFVPAGTHAVSWRVQSRQPMVALELPEQVQGVLDDVQITPLAAAGLADALDTALTPQLTQGADLSGRWRGMAGMNQGIRGNSVVCGPLGSGEVTECTVPVSGPARLLLSLRGERWDLSRRIAFSARLDDNKVLHETVVDAATAGGSTENPWHTVEIPVPAGAHTLKLRATGQGDGALLWMDALTVLPADPGTRKLGGALDYRDTVWQRVSPPGAGGWRVLGTPMAREGESLVACMDVRPGQMAALEAPFTGPGTLSFTWGLPAAGDSLALPGGRDLRLLIDGEAVGTVWLPPSGGNRELWRVALPLPAGTHLLRWEYRAPDEEGVEPGVVQAWVDAVDFTPAPVASNPAAGFDVATAMSTGGDWPWSTVATPQAASGDGDAAVVDLAVRGGAWLEMPFTGPGRFAFWWRRELAGDEEFAATFLIDGSPVQAMPGNNDWFRMECMVGPGSHTLRWEAAASHSDWLGTAAGNRLWLDGFQALPVLPLHEALDNSLTWNTGAPGSAGDHTTWTGLPAAETAALPGGDDAAVTDGTRPLTTQVTGPGVVTFRWAEKLAPVQQRLMVNDAPASGGPVAAGLGLATGTLSLSFWEWNFTSPPVVRGIFSMDARTHATLTTSQWETVTDFRTHSVHLGPGTHTLTWQRPWITPDRRLVLESVQFTPGTDALTPVAAELGLSPAQFLMPAAPWTVQSVTTHDGTAALQSPFGTGESATLELPVTGPGRLSFWWKGTGSADFRSTAHDVQENSGIIIIGPPLRWYAPGDWQLFTLDVPAGPQTYIWRVPAGNMLWLDEFRFASPQPLAGPNAVQEALDFAGLTWNAPGWEPLTGGLRDTGDALRGPAWGGPEIPWLETQVTGPASFAFSWWMDNFSGNTLTASPQPVTVKLNGVAAVYDSSQLLPQQKLVSIPAGQHTLRLEFPGGANPGTHPVLDDVRLEVPAGTALGLPAQEWSSSGALHPWRGWQSARFPGRSDWVESPGIGGQTPLSTIVTGPATLTFDYSVEQTQWWRMLIGTPETLRLYDGTVELWRAPAVPSGWQTLQVSIPPGTHTLIWKPGGGILARLDNMSLTPDAVPAPDFAAAVEAPGIAFTDSTFSNPPYLWTPVRLAPSGSHDDAVRAVQNSAGPAHFLTPVQGPVWVTFDYRGEGLPLKFLVDGGTEQTLSPGPGWQTSRRFYIPEDNHVLGWETGAVQPGTAGAWLEMDALKIEPVYSAPGILPLAEALDWPGLDVVSNPAGAWTGRSVEGQDVAEATAWTDSLSLTATVNGPGTIVFRWKRETGAPLNFLVDGGYARSFAAADGVWVTEHWPLPPGTHTLVWQARPPYSGHRPGKVWVDDLKLLPAPTLAAALEAPAGVALAVGAGAPAPFTRPDGSDAVFLSAQTGGHAVTAAVTGPGELSFEWLPWGLYTAAPPPLLLDGQPVGSTELNNFTRGSFRVAIAVGPGPHVITWQSGIAAADAAGVTLDDVRWSSGVPAWAAAAGGIGSNGVTAWVSSGGGPWSAVPGAFPGGAAAETSAGWIQAVVLPGSGTLCWWGRTLHDEPARRLTGPSGTGFWSSDWRLVRERSATGGPLPLWHTEQLAQLAGISFTPDTTVSLAQALDAPAAVFETEPAAPWTGIVEAEAPSGGSAARAAYTMQADGSWIRTSFTGPGKLTWSWRMTRRNSLPSAVLKVNGGFEQPLAWNGPDWQRSVLWLPAGTSTLQWTFRPAAPGDEFWLDALQFTPSAPVSLVAALEYSGAPWTTGGDGMWTGRLPLEETTGDDAALSPALEAGGESWLETTVPGSGVLTWRWRRLREAGPARFDMQLNGLPLAELSNEDGWVSERWELPAGPHTLRWRCVAGIAGEGQALLDDVTFTPAPPPAWPSVMGGAGIKAGGGGASSWTLVPDAAGDFLRTVVGDSNYLHSSTLFADVTGPAFVSAQVRPESGYEFSSDDAWQYRGGSGDWQERPAHFIPAGTSRLRWRVFSPLQLDVRRLRIMPLQSVTLADALEAQGLTVFNDAANSWSGLRNPADAGSEDFAAAVVPGGTTRSLEAEFTGPGVLRATWAWTEIRGNGTPLLRLSEGGTALRSDYLGGNFPDNRFGYEMVFGPGIHRVQLTVDLTGQLVETFAPRLENLHFEAWPVTDIATAFDAPGRTFTTGGEGWIAGLLRPELAAVGNSTVWMRGGSGNPPVLETQVTGPAHLAFRYRLSAAGGSGLLVSVDGVQQRSATISSGQEASGTETLRVPAGVHTVRWQWQGIFAVPYEALNAALLDGFVLTPGSVVSLPEAADSPGLTFTPQGGTWTGLTGPEAVNGGDFIEATRAGAQPVSMTLQLTGPGVLRWAWRNSDRGYGPVLSAVLQSRVWAEAGPYMSNWQQGFMAVPPGVQTITFTATGDSLTDSMAWFDDFSWRPTTAGVTLETALEAGGVSGLSVLEAGDWFPVDDPQLFPGGGDALFAGVPGRAHTLRAQASGPGTLAFVTNTQLTVLTDGSAATLQIPGPLTAMGGSRRLHFSGTAGAKTFDVIHPWQAFYRSQYDHAWLDGLTYIPALPAALPAALDQPRWTFRTGGPVPWTGATTPSGTNGSLAWSTLTASAPGAAPSWIETDLTGPGVLFAHFATAGTGRVYLDGILQVNGLPLTVPAGPHTVRWAIQQNTPAVNLTALLDNIEWQPGTWPLWQAQHFAPGTPAEAMALDADPDADGAPNGVEAFLSTAPGVRNDLPPLEITASQTGQPRIAFSHAVHLPAGLRFSVESAASPAGPWTEQTGVTQGEQWTGTSYVEGTSPPSQQRRYFFGPAGQRFYRMKVTPLP